MKRRTLLQQDLAHALGISPAMVSRLKRQGMPTHSVAAAAEWRRRNLDPAQLLEQATRRGRASPTGRAVPHVAPVDDGRRALEQVALLAEAAAADFDRWGEQLRAAMAVLPRARWDEVALPATLWERLLGPYHLNELRAGCPEADEGATPTDEDAAVVGDLIYQLAAGLARILPEPAVHTSPLPGDDATRHG